MDGMRNLDAHIEGRHGPFTGNNPWSPGPPPGVEDVMESIILWPSPAEEPFDCARCIGTGKRASVHTGQTYECPECKGSGKDPPTIEFGQVTDYEEWEDEDEDGKHGGVTLTVKHLETGETATVELANADEWAVPAEPPELRKAADALFKAKVLARQAEDERRRARAWARKVARERIEAKPK